MLLRTYLLSKIHKAVITEANLDYVGSVTIDSELLDRTGMQAGEKVLIVDNTNGARLETYIIAGAAGSGCIEINGAAAHLVNKGDEVIIMNFGMSDKPVEPVAILVDKQNRYLQDLTERPSTIV